MKPNYVHQQNLCKNCHYVISRLAVDKRGLIFADCGICTEDPLCSMASGANVILALAIQPLSFWALHHSFFLISSLPHTIPQASKTFFLFPFQCHWSAAHLFEGAVKRINFSWHTAVTSLNGAYQHNQINYLLRRWQYYRLTEKYTKWWNRNYLFVSTGKLPLPQIWSIWTSKKKSLPFLHEEHNS